MMIQRSRHLQTLTECLQHYPVVAILGARQVGKTTLARQLVDNLSGPATVFDLENPRHLARLDDPLLALESLRGLVVLDEIQRRPDLFPVLRVLADRRPLVARFLALGSAAPDLLRQSSESLAGRIHYHHPGGLTLDEVGAEALERLWVRGGFPASFLARTPAQSHAWRQDFIRTFLERDLPQLGVRVPAVTLQRTEQRTKTPVRAVGCWIPAAGRTTQPVRGLPRPRTNLFVPSHQARLVQAAV